MFDLRLWSESAVLDFACSNGSLLLYWHDQSLKTHVFFLRQISELFLWSEYFWSDTHMSHTAKAYSRWGWVVLFQSLKWQGKICFFRVEINFSCFLTSFTAFQNSWCRGSQSLEILITSQQIKHQLYSFVSCASSRVTCAWAAWKVYFSFSLPELPVLKAMADFFKVSS